MASPQPRRPESSSRPTPPAPSPRPGAGLGGSNREVYEQSEVVARYEADAGLHVTERLAVERWFPAAPARVLDLGCGGGRTTEALVAMGYEVAAMDLAAGMVRATRRRVPEASALVMDATDLAFRDRSFDAAIFSFNGLDCIGPRSQRVRALTEVRRVLAPGAPFLCSGHNVLGVITRDGRADGLRAAAFRARRLLADQRHPAMALAGYWQLGDQRLYAAPPARHLRQLVEAGFTVQWVLGNERHGDPPSLALRGHAPAGNGIEVVGLPALSWGAAHVHFVATTPR